jgi:hypothetical protein
MFTAVAGNKLYQAWRTVPQRSRLCHNGTDWATMLFVIHQNLRNAIQTILTKIKSNILRVLMLAKETVA